jgi:hypothetical protein
MLRGTKPLAYFLNVVASEFHFNIRYRRMFDRHVAAGRLIKREVFEVLSDLEHRRLVYALPVFARGATPSTTPVDANKPSCPCCGARRAGRRDGLPRERFSPMALSRPFH